MKSTNHSTLKTSNQVATVVFVDAGVENYQQLVNGVIPTAEVFVLDAAIDGIEQISQILQQRQNVGAVHIVSHGAPGCLYLGNTQLSLDTFNRYAAQLQQWDVANLLVYGCNVAAGDAGEEFVEKLHRLTGAGVAASRWVIGDGYWSLDVRSTGTTALAPFNEAVLATWTGRLAPSINNLSNSSYTEQGLAFVLDNDISFSGGTDYRGGYIEFSLNSATSFDNLTLITDGSPSTINGQISIVGNTVYLGNGINTAVIGSVDSTFNGQNGQNLRLNFSNEFKNGDFNLGSSGSTTISGWTTVNQQVKFGTDTIAGLPTPLDMTIPANAGNADQNTPSNPGTMETALDPTQNDGFGNSVRLTSSGITTAQGYDIVRGPYIYSNSTVSLSAGDQVSFEWQAQGGADAYDVYGYIVDVNTNRIETILNETGGSTNASTTWAKETITVSQAGEYRFVFVAGTYDFSGGRAAGAQLYIDDVSVIQAVPSTALNDSHLSSIAQRVQYNNTSDTPDTSKTLTVSVQNSISETASATATISITPVDDPAIIGGDISGIGSEGTSITGTLTATDPEGLTDGSVFSIQFGNEPTSGSASINAATGEWSYTSTTNFNGSDAFTVTITDDQGGTTTQVINLTVPDTQAPVLESATVNGTSLVLTYNETLDGASDPAASTFTVNVNGSPVTVTGVDANSSTVTLTLATPVQSLDAVTVDYTVSGSNPIQDEAGNDAPSFSGQSVTYVNEAPTATRGWDFVTRDYQLDGDTDIVAIKQNDTGTGSTEVHIMDAATNYQSWLLQTGTALGVTDDTWDFVKGDHDRDGKTDIFSIQKSGTGTGTTEIHILDAATNYQSFVLHTGTALGMTGDNFDFQGADCNRDGYTDIIAIQKSGTGSGRTEIHILDGKSGYKSWQLNTATALAPTDNSWEFQVGDYNGDSITDIVGLKQSDTGTATTEVHVLNGATNYQSFVLQTGTALAQTGDNWGFLMDDYSRSNPMGIIGLKESDTGTGTTEAHILNQGDVYQSWRLQTGSVLPEVAPSELV